MFLTIYNGNVQPYVVSRLMIAFGLSCMWLAILDNGISKSESQKWLALGIASFIGGIVLRIVLHKGLM